MPRTIQCWAIKDFNDVILIPTVAGSDVLAMTRILVGMKLYNPKPDDGYLHIRKQFHKLAGPKGYKACQIMITEIVDESHKELKGTHLEQRKRSNRGNKKRSCDRQKRPGRGIDPSTGQVLQIG